MTTSNEPSCPLCDKQGLLIVPTIYALARSDAGKAPALQAPFAEDLSLPASAHFTLRLPRATYMYMFDEARDEWTGYTVSPQGYLMPFKPGEKAPAMQPNKKFDVACSRKGDPYAARCIAIKDADLATTVWLGLSDTPWTLHVLNLHADASYRQAHMRSIDVQAWVISKGSTPQPHVSRLQKLGELVAEFVPDANASLKTPVQQKALVKASGDQAKKVWEQGAFGFSVSPFSPETPSFAPAFNTWATAQSAPIPPMLVALNDPVGIAADINGLAMQRMAEWLEMDATRKWKKETSLTIDLLSEAVKKQAVEERRQRDIENVDKEWGQSSLAGYSMAMGNRLEEEIGKVNRKIARESDSIGEDAWSKYRDGAWYTSKSYDDIRRKADDAVFNATLQAFDQQTITPLSSAYLVLIRSAAFKAHFTHNHDPKDINSGHDYLQMALLCVKDACGRDDVRKVFQAHMADDPSDRDNIWIRALILDQEKAVAKLADSAGLEGEHEVPWREMAEKLNEAFKTVIGKGIEHNGHFTGVLDKVAHYVYQIAGPITARLGKAFDASLTWGMMKLPEKRLLSVLSWTSQKGVNGKTLVFLSSELTPRQVARQMAAIVAEIAAAPKSGLRTGMRDIVSDAYNAQPYMGEDTGRPGKFRFAALIDNELAGRLNGLQGTEHQAERSSALRQAVTFNTEMTSSQMEEIVRSSVKGVTNSEFRLGVVGLIFAGWSLKSNWGKDVADGTAASRSKYVISAMGAFGAMVEIVGNAAEGTIWGGIKLSRPIQTMILQAETRASLAAGVGKIMGAVAGIALGIWEFGEGLSEYKENHALGSLHVASGAASIGVGLMILFNLLTPGVGFVLFIIIAIITFIASFFIDDKFQSWLRKCYYGDSEDKYVDLNEQQVALEKMTAQTKPGDSEYRKTFDKLLATQPGFVGTKL